MLASLTFLADLPLYADEKPYQIKGFVDVAEENRTNVVRETVADIQVHDARRKMTEFDFEAQGFEWLEHHSIYAPSSSVFEDHAQSNPYVAAYLQETIQLVQDTLTASRVVCFDWRVRKNIPEIVSQNAPTDVALSRYQVAPPVSIAHIDFSAQGGRDRVALHLNKAEIADIASRGSRVRMVNVWRPFHTVSNAPLALCDRRTVRNGDALEVEEVLPTHIELEAFMQHRDYHQWHWLSNQQPHQPCMFLTWDNMSKRSDGGGVPHAACVVQGEDKGLTPRESIEVRLMVID